MSSVNPWILMGAAFVGVISAAGIFIVEQFRQNQRHKMSQNLARLNRELSDMRWEMKQLKDTQKEKNNKYGNRIKRRPKSVVSSSAVDDDSSDLEFYDLSDEEDTQDVAPLEKELIKVDEMLDSSHVNDITEALERLEALCMQNPESPKLMWRVGKAYYNIADTCLDSVKKQANINKGIQVCGAALSLRPAISEVHKWYAILVGSRSEYQLMKDRISDGYLFKKHVDIAINLDPADPALYHLLGRFNYEVAGLKWYERQVASALYGKPPSATYEDALYHLMKAERLSKQDFKENKMFIGKCLLANEDMREGLRWLKEAANVVSVNKTEKQCDAEIRTILAKYNTYT